jgi:hypothetical protein
METREKEKRKGNMSLTLPTAKYSKKQAILVSNKIDTF